MSPCSTRQATVVRRPLRSVARARSTSGRSIAAGLEVVHRQARGDVRRRPGRGVRGDAFLAPVGRERRPDGMAVDHRGDGAAVDDARMADVVRRRLPPAHQLVAVPAALDLQSVLVERATAEAVHLQDILQCRSRVFQANLRLSSRRTLSQRARRHKSAHHGTRRRVYRATTVVRPAAGAAAWPGARPRRACDSPGPSARRPRASPPCAGSA